MLQIKFKKNHPEAKTPTKGTEFSAGWDLYAADGISGVGKRIFDTGVCVEIPKGYVGLVFPRSSICKTNNRLVNGVGVIDSDYRGSIKFYFDELDLDSPAYRTGDRIGQLIIIPYPEINFFEVEELSESKRNQGGFGSTGGLSQAW